MNKSWNNKKIKLIVLLLFVFSNSFSQRIRKEWSEFTNNERQSYILGLASLDDAFVTEMAKEHYTYFNDENENIKTI